MEHDTGLVLDPYVRYLRAILEGESVKLAEQRGYVKGLSTAPEAYIEVRTREDKDK